MSEREGERERVDGGMEGEGETQRFTTSNKTTAVLKCAVNGDADTRW